MTDRGILFSAPMALALKAGEKTQTRRLSTRINPGDRLWVREAFRLESVFDTYPPSLLPATSYEKMCVWHEADCGAPAPVTRSTWGHPFGRLRPGLHMPRWASRITLLDVDVRRERLQAITHADILAEGLVRAWRALGGIEFDPADEEIARIAFATIWDQINAGRRSGESAAKAEARTWAANPEVSRISFRPVMEAIGIRREAA